MAVEPKSIYDLEITYRVRVHARNEGQALAVGTEAIVKGQPVNMERSGEGTVYSTGLPEQCCTVLKLVASA